MNPAELIRIVEVAGGRFLIDGGKLGISPKEAAAPVLDQLREHKAAIISLLTLRALVPPSVRIIKYAPKAAPIRLSKCSVVTSTELFVRTTLEQLAADLMGLTWQSGNWGCAELLRRLATCGVEVEIVDGS